MTKQKKQLLRQFWKKSRKISFFLLLLLLIIGYFVYKPSEIFGTSMAPTLTEGDHILVETVGKIKRFDGIVFYDKGARPVVKRVIGLPGDTLYYHNDRLFINGKVMHEPYLEPLKDEHFSGLLTSNFTLDQATGSPVIPEGEYFVMGDNRRFSFDSRHYGNISNRSIIGKVVVIYFPLEHFSFFK